MLSSRRRDDAIYYRVGCRAMVADLMGQVSPRLSHIPRLTYIVLGGVGGKRPRRGGVRDERGRA